LSMKTAWRDAESDQVVTAPVSLIVSAFAPVDDVRRTLTPLLRLDRDGTVLIRFDLANGARRLGGSVLAQVYGQLGNEATDLDDPRRPSAFFALLRTSRTDERSLPTH